MSSSTEATPKLKLTLKLNNSSSSNNSAAPSLTSSKPDSTTISPVKKASKAKKAASEKPPSEPSIASEEPEAAFDLRTFITQMQSFKPRPWCLQPRVSLSRNVANELVTVGSGAWCTSVAEVAKLELPQSTPLLAIQSCPICAKSFKDASKYAKHVKTHEKTSKRPKLAENSSTSTITSTTKPPVSIKLKFQ